MEKIKDKLKDLLGASGEETVTALTESTLVPEATKAILERMVSEGTAEIVGSIFAGALPRVNGILINYKQNRFERNVNKALIEFENKISIIDEKMETLSQELVEKFKDLYAEWFLDLLESERQDIKIPYLVNGYISMMNNTTNDDLMLLFFSTLSDLTDLDINVLKIYHYACNDNIYTLMDEKNLIYEQIDLVKEKLLRNGLLESKNDEQREKNLDEVVRFATDLAKQIKATKPKEVKAPKTKKISRSESYSITKLGRNYLEMLGVI